MTPYYQEMGAAGPRVTLYHGDCAVLAPQLGTFSLLMTDPPYGIGEAAGKNKSRTKLAKARDYGDLTWDDRPPEPWVLDMLISKAAHACIFGGNYFALPPSSCWLVWDKENGESDFADAELAWTNYPSAVRLKRHRWAGMLRKGNEERYHPTQKPYDVIAWAIAHAPERPAGVFDPYAGSGTTLRVCKDLGINVVGIEAEETYCKLIVERLSQQTLGLA